nr:pyrrolo-quinoline quinone [uncultured bacterium]BAH90530.1 pyrrolo-quinoline quinone [uncultured bacterium]
MHWATVSNNVNLSLRIAGAVALALVVAGCATVADVGKGAARGVSRAGESIAGRLTAADAPQVEAELPTLDREFAVTVAAEFRVTDGTPDGFPKPRPAFTDDAVYTLGEDRDVVFAHALQEGERLWRARLKAVVTGGVGVGDGLVLVGTANGAVIALDASDGKERWRAELKSEVLTPPTARDGIAVVATGDGHLYGLSSADGARKWSIERDVPTLSLRGGSTPMTTALQAIHGFADGHLAAVDLRTGRSLWNVPIARPRGRTDLERMVDVDCQPVIANGAVFAAAYQGRVGAVDLATGAVGWGREVSCDSALAADTFNVYLTDVDDRVLALDQRSGRVFWEQKELEGRHLTAPAVLGTALVVADVEGYVHWLSTDDGRLLGRSRPTKDAFLLPPQVHNGRVYLISESGRLYALEAGS